MSDTIGLDMGGTKCLGVRVNKEGEIVAVEKVPTADTHEAIIDVLAEVAERLSIADEPIGVGVPGLVDRDGHLWFGPNLNRVADVPVRVALAKRLGDNRQLVVENDATCHGWAEGLHGAAVGSKVALMVTLGTGIGGAIMLDGVPFVGAHGFSGEFGHMQVNPSGALCACGRRGCWEVVASGRGLGALGREVGLAGEAPSLVELADGDPEAIRGETVTAAAREGDEAAQAVLGRFGWWVAVGLAALTQAIDPDRIVIGGGLVESADVILQPIQQAYREQLRIPVERPDVQIVAAKFGEEAGAVGAAVLARRQLSL